MPTFYKKDLLARKELPPVTAGVGYEDHLLESPLDHPALPQGDQQPKQDTTNHGQIDDFDPSKYREPVRTLITWKAVSRPFRKKDRSYYTTTAILVILISLILFLAGERLLVGVIFALGFLVYVLSFVSPDDAEYRISTQGVTIGEHFYHWEGLDSFWFSQKDGHTTLNILTRVRFPGMLILVLNDTVDIEELKSVCAKYLPFHEIVPKSLIDKWADALQKHFPLENSNR